MGEFEDCDYRDCDLVVACPADYAFEQLASVLALTFSGNGSRRVKDQSQCGGSRAS